MDIESILPSQSLDHIIEVSVPMNKNAERSESYCEQALSTESDHSYSLENVFSAVEEHTDITFVTCSQSPNLWLAGLYINQIESTGHVKNTTWSRVMQWDIN